MIVPRPATSFRRGRRRDRRSPSSARIPRERAGGTARPRTSSRCRSRSGRRRSAAARPYHSARCGAGDSRASASRASCPAARAGRHGPAGAVLGRGRASARSPLSVRRCQRHESAQRERVVQLRSALGVGEQLEEDAGPGVVVVHGGHDQLGGRARQRAGEQPQFVVHRGAAPVDGAERRRRRRAWRHPPAARCRADSPQARVRPHAVLHAGDDDGVELQVPSAPAGVRMRTASSRVGRLQAVLRDSRCRGSPHEHARRSASSASPSAPRTASPLGTGRPGHPDRDAPARRADRCRVRAPPRRARGRCGPTRSTAARAAVAPRSSSSRSAASVRASDAGAPRLARVEQVELQRLPHRRQHQVALPSASRSSRRVGFAPRPRRSSTAAQRGVTQGRAQAAQPMTSSPPVAPTRAVGDILDASTSCFRARGVRRAAAGRRTGRIGAERPAGPARRASAPPGPTARPRAPPPAACRGRSRAHLATGTPSCTCRSRRRRATASYSSAVEFRVSARTEASGSASAGGTRDGRPRRPRRCAGSPAPRARAATPCRGARR